jgi:hypothetical protein
MTDCNVFEVSVGGEQLNVCPTCGESGGIVYAVLPESRAIAIDNGALPGRGELIVRGIETRLDGALYALTVAYEFAGKIEPFNGIVSIFVPLELADECEFVIRDDFNGCQRRPVSTLSGGETFLTSLALALALSSKIQLKGQPLGFFFLDEGFGTLDAEKLDLVIGALEKLHDRERMVGIISHVKELKERLPRYLEVTPATQDGQGSRLALHHN